jgi:hypothetical protein
VAPVTDWRLYDTAYTERCVPPLTLPRRRSMNRLFCHPRSMNRLGAFRFMNTPQLNAAGYDAGSVLVRAAGPPPPPNTH